MGRGLISAQSNPDICEFGDGKVVDTCGRSASSLNSHVRGATQDAEEAAMRTSAIAVAALVIVTASTAFGQAPPPTPSTFSLLGIPVNPPLTSVVVPIPLDVSLNPDPLPPVPDPNANLDLSDRKRPVYSYPKSPAFEIEDFSFDIEQVLNIGSGSSGGGEGKITFDPFHVTSTLGQTVVGNFHLIDVGQNQILETFT